jgi:hypothetical protein
MVWRGTDARRVVAGKRWNTETVEVWWLLPLPVGSGWLCLRLGGGLLGSAVGEGKRSEHLRANLRQREARERNERVERLEREREMERRAVERWRRGRGLGGGGSVGDGRIGGGMRG